MAFTLIEHAKTTENQLASAVVEEFARSSVVLQLLPFKEIVGNAYKYNKEERLPGIAFRGLNESYDESTGLVNPVTEHMKIMGGDADTDKALMKMEKNFGARRASDVLMKTKAASLYFTKIFFDGDESSDIKQFDGMNQRLTGDQVISGGTDGGNLSHALLQQVIDAVKGSPGALFMGKKFRRQLNNLSESSTILSITKDMFGDPITAYASIPIYIVEEDNEDNTILAFDETQGNSDITASCYAVRFGVDEFVCGLQIEPLEVVDLGEIDEKPVFRTRIEWLMTIAIFHSKSAARLKGITAAVE